MVRTKNSNFKKMKKKTLIVATAALLLSGGVFVMTNQENSSLAESNIDALSQFEYYPGYEYGYRVILEDDKKGAVACCALGSGYCTGSICGFDED